MIRRTPGIRSSGTTPGRYRQRGFSLVEVVMSVVLLAIGVTLAVPSYRNIVDQRQIPQDTSAIASFIDAARDATSKIRRPLTISYSQSGTDHWCVGAVAGETACDCTQSDKLASDFCSIAARPHILKKVRAEELELLHAIEGDGTHVAGQCGGESVNDPSAYPSCLKHEESES